LELNFEEREQTYIEHDARGSKKGLVGLEGRKGRKIKNIRRIKTFQEMIK
jgi:hypothetical protein